MATKQKSKNTPTQNGLKNISDYRHLEASRKNNPPAKIAAEGYVPMLPKAEYSYSPRLAPALRFDPTGSADELPELLAKAPREKLSEAEARALGVDHSYEPDFIVRLRDGTTVILEIKGYEGDQAKAKHNAARRWVAAVNNWGGLGRWDFLVCRNPQVQDRELEYLSATGEAGSV